MQLFCPHTAATFVHQNGESLDLTAGEMSSCFYETITNPLPLLKEYNISTFILLKG